MTMLFELHRKYRVQMKINKYSYPDFNNVQKTGLTFKK